MFDIYKNCDPRDDDNWSFGMLFVWFMGGFIALCVILSFIF